MINITSQEECCGCNACINVCPKQCIDFNEDKEGFYYPLVDRDKCIDCNLCEEICPILQNTNTNTRYEIPKAFAVWNNDEQVRLESTSGGAFSVLANQMFEQDGYVAAAVYTENFEVEHIISNDVNDLHRMRSSKYVQSNVSDLYNVINNKLKDGNKVLVCAAPCQIAALYNTIGIDYENLITCDFICRGVNSPKVFLRYVNWLQGKFKSPIESIKFKDKTLGWRSLAIKVNFKNGKTYLGDRSHDPFMVGYLRNNSFIRPACHQCEFKDLPRYADISLADFWGIEKLEPNLDDNKGTSLVLLNSKKGEEFFMNSASGMKFKEFPFLDAIAENPAFSHSPEIKANRDVFFDDLDELTFDKVINKYFKTNNLIKKKIVKLTKYFNAFPEYFEQMKFSPSAWWTFLQVNYIRKNTNSNKKYGIIPTGKCVFMIEKGSMLNFNGRLIFGWREFAKSKVESRLQISNSGTLIVNGYFSIYAGADIRIVKDGVLTLNSGYINDFVQIVCAKKITIGNNCAIARNVVIRDYDAHEIEGSIKNISEEIIIGNHVWIASNVTILKGVHIGDGAIIAAGAIVTKDIPANSLAAGIPARVIKNNVIWK